MILLPIIRTPTVPTNTLGATPKTPSVSPRAIMDNKKNHEIPKADRDTQH